MSLKTAKSVLKKESASIERAAERLTDSFESCVESVFALKGKVIVCGLGKSGHVGGKIAATLASTGTSSFFLHANEAVHGDMGMIQSSDALVAISYSGKTPELIEVCKYAKRLGVYIIALTGVTDSPLAQIASYVLDGSVTSEADTLDLAPSASSTVAMALGDALAISLMEKRGFDADGFANLHPRGSLGIQLTKINSLMRAMNSEMKVSLNSSVSECLQKMNKTNYGVIGVFDQDKLVGCITDGDIRRYILNPKHGDIVGVGVSKVMAKNPKTIDLNLAAISAVKVMEEHKVTTLFVQDGDATVGLLRLHDLMEAKIV